MLSFRHIQELQGVLSQLYPWKVQTGVSYNRFVELMPRVFFKMMMFMKLYAFGKCSGISFVDSTMIPVCHNVRRYFNKVFKGLARNGKGTMAGATVSSYICCATTVER